MPSPTNEELGVDSDGFPPRDASGDVDVNQIECNLRLSPAERIRRNSAASEFVAAARRARIRLHGFDPATARQAE